jgi:pilus assembly protein CpaF
MDALAFVEDRVRERVRRAGLDPVAEPATVRELIAEVLDDHADEVADLGLAPGSRDQLVRDVHDAVAGFGPLQRWLDDDSIEEIWINDPGRVFVSRRGRSELTSTILTEQVVRDLVERMLKATGRRVDISTPFVDATLPDGSRLHVVIPDIVRRHWAVNIRKFVAPAQRLDDLVALGTLTEQAARFLEAAVVAGLNVIVAGGTGAGKTTLLTCLLHAVPARERIVTAEEVFELRLRTPDWVAMQTRQSSLEGTGEVRLRRLVKESLRMRPDRLVIGEVRQEEALDLLIALNSGQPGMCTVHANSAREAVTKLCTLPLLAGENVSAGFVTPTVAGCVDLVVHVASEVDGRRRVREIVALPGRVEDGVVEVADVFLAREGRLVRGHGFPPHPDRFAARGYDLAALLADSVAPAREVA